MKTQKVNAGTARAPQGTAVKAPDALLALLKEDQTWNAKQRKYNELAEGVRQLERVILRSESDLKTELGVWNYQWNEKRVQASNLSDYEKEFEYISRQYHKLRKLQEQLNQITEDGLGEKVRLELWRKEIDALESELEKTRAGGAGRCKVCDRPVEDADQTRWVLRQEDRLTELKGRTTAHEDKIRELRTVYMDVEKDIKELGDVQKMLANAEHRLSEARSAEHDGLALKDEMEKIKQKLAHRTFAKREAQAIEDLEKRIKENAYDAIRHDEIKGRIREWLEKNRT